MADQEEDPAEQWCNQKSALMEQLLGKEHDMVMHAIIPYAVGGGLDLYYYPNGIPGTAIATKELSELPGEGSSNRVFRTYELVMFTRHTLDLDAARDNKTPFGRAHGAINSALNQMAPYSAQTSLNPNETCELAGSLRFFGRRCLVFDAYPTASEEAQAEFGLLAAIEIFRSEMNFARKQGGAKLILRLKDRGYYPYSDLDRKPVA